MPVTINGSGTIAGVPGSILQVQSTTKTDTFSTSSTSLVDVTGLSVTISPRSATSQILVMVNLNFGADPSVTAMHGAIFRGSTQIALGDAAGSRARRTWVRCSSQASGTGAGTMSMTFLDSPATTSATTYKVQILSDQSGSVYINRTAGDADASYMARGVSSITLMEVAA